MSVVAPAAAPVDVPPARGRWRFTLHNRAFSANVTPANSNIGELVDARSRRLEQKWNEPATLTWTLDGRSQAAAQVAELAMDVMAWRWDDTTGRDRAMFRGVIAQSEDQISEQAHTVTYTAHDYLAMLKRRFITYKIPVVYTQMDQDTIVANLLVSASASNSSGGTGFSPGSFIPLQVIRCNPDGTIRPTSGVLRDRTYFGGQEIGEAVDNLANVLGGFDYDAYPSADGNASPLPYPAGIDALRVFYPVQGTTRADMALVYGSTVSTVTRSVNSADFANYVRLLGNNGESDPAMAQLVAEAWTSDAATGTPGATGLWMTAENASDVTLQNTLNEQAQGTLALMSTLIPSYSLGMRPGAYRWGFPRMGDTVPLVIQSGRLNVNTTVRVLGLTYDIGDDGQEDVELTVGRPAVTLAALLAANRRDVNALARR